MKSVKVSLVIAGVALIGIGAAMALTNPKQDAYNQFATQRLSQYLEEEVCPDAGNLFLKSSCTSLVKDNQSAIRDIIVSSTKRQDYWLWSTYQTNLSLDPILPSILDGVLPAYRVSTIGVFNQFLIHQAQKQ